MCSAVSDSVTPWTTARQTPLSMGFFRQEYWSGLLLLTPDHLPDPGTEPRFPAGVFFTTESPGKPHTNRKKYVHFLNHQKPVGFLFMKTAPGHAWRVQERRPWQHIVAVVPTQHLLLLQAAVSIPFGKAPPTGPLWGGAGHMLQVWPISLFYPCPGPGKWVVQ